MCGNKFIQRLNKKYFGKDRPTDVIAFPLSGGVDPFNILGEIVISLEQVKANAVFYGVGFEEELSLCIIHGILHLAGYKDSPEKEWQKMEKKQNILLRKAKKLKIV